MLARLAFLNRQLSLSILFLLMVGFNLAWANEQVFSLTQLSKELDRPWAVEVLPDGRVVITERGGTLRIYDKGELSQAIEGLPAVYNAGQGGLLDVKAHPDFAKNAWLYFTYSSGSATKNRTVLARAQLRESKLQGQKLQDVVVLFEAEPSKKQAYHFAGRIEFLPDRSLVFGVGDGYFYKEQAQELSSHLGKFIRLRDDGSIPTDNPFVSNSKAKPAIFSLGHRNPQGVFYDSKRKVLFSNEHGPKGGDEINILQAGSNYGWPTITYGVNYDGSVISELTHKAGMQQPLHQWTPSIAPSSMVVYYGKTFPGWHGHLLTTTLKYQELRLVKLAQDGMQLNVIEELSLLKNKGERLRDIAVDNKGRVLLITDSGKLWRLEKPEA